MTAVEAALMVDRVCKSYGSVAALSDVTFRVDYGTVHGLVGPNGAGKTTLLASLLGLVLPDSGTISVLGRRPGVGGKRLAGVAGFVEAPAFYPYLTGRRNLQLLAALDDGHPADDAVDDVLATVGLSAAGSAKFRTYSLGMRQRLGLAAALLRRPRLLIIDEPTNGLDPGGIRDLGTGLRDLAATGVAVLLSSHDMTQIAETCDAVTILHRGSVCVSGSIDRLHELAPQPSWVLRTSDDLAALAEASRALHQPVRTVVDGGLRFEADQPTVDALVVALGRRGVAVRHLSQRENALQSLFFGLTEQRQLDPEISGVEMVGAR